MKSLRVLLLCVLVSGGVIASAVPIFAAQNPVHPTAPYTLDDDPTPTPTPIIYHTNGDDCSGGGC